MGIATSLPKARQKLQDKSMYSRRAYHSGSWYASDPDELDNLLSNFLADAERSCLSAPSAVPMNNGHSENGVEFGVKNSVKRCAGVPRACICPHAGFQYSGLTAAYSYLALKEALLTNSSLRTIVVIHPSHHIYLDGCAVSGEIETSMSMVRSN